MHFSFIVVIFMALYNIDGDDMWRKKRRNVKMKVTMISTQTTVPAFDAIRGQRSAYENKKEDNEWTRQYNVHHVRSIINKKVRIKKSRRLKRKGVKRGRKKREITHTFFCNRSSNRRSLHFTLGIDNDACVILDRYNRKNF